MSRIIKYWQGWGCNRQAGPGKKKGLSMMRVSAELEDYCYQRKKQSRSGQFGIKSYVDAPLIKS